MSFFAPMLAALLLADAPQVELSLLSGELQVTADPAANDGAEIKQRLSGARHAGKLVELSAESIVLETGDGKRVVVPVEEVEQLHLAAASAIPAAPETPAWVELTDESRLRCETMAMTADHAQLKSPVFGEVRLPRASVRSIRFETLEGDLRAAWDRLVDRESKRDRLIIRKNQTTLDFLDGVIGRVEPEAISFLFDGEEVTVNRSKVFGVLFSAQPSPAQRGKREIQFRDGSTLRLAELNFAENHLRGRLPSGGEISVPAGHVERIDFSPGAVTFLDAMEPRSAEVTIPFDVLDAERSLYQFRRIGGGARAARIGNYAFARGLWMHSKSQIVYRLGGDYRRLQAVMGIDAAVEARELARLGMGDVRVVITGRTAGGNERVLFEADVHPTDDPRILDADLTGVIELELLVDYGTRPAGSRDDDPLADLAAFFGDQLVLGDAKLIR